MQATTIWVEGYASTINEVLTEDRPHTLFDHGLLVRRITRLSFRAELWNTIAPLLPALPYVEELVLMPDFGHVIASLTATLKCRGLQTLGLRMSSLQKVLAEDVVGFVKSCLPACHCRCVYAPWVSHTLAHSYALTVCSARLYNPFFFQSHSQMLASCDP